MCLPAAFWLSFATLIQHGILDEILLTAVRSQRVRRVGRVRNRVGATHFTEILLSGKFTCPYGVTAADLDGDDDPTASDARGRNSVYWFEDEGGRNICAALGSGAAGRAMS